MHADGYTTEFLSAKQSARNMTDTSTTSYLFGCIFKLLTDKDGVTKKLSHCLVCFTGQTVSPPPERKR